MVIILRDRAKTNSGRAGRRARTEQVRGWTTALLTLCFLGGAWGHLPEGAVVDNSTLDELLARCDEMRLLRSGAVDQADAVSRS